MGRANWRRSGNGAEEKDQEKTMAGEGGKTNKLNISLEFFPPQSEAMETRLWESLGRLAPIDPDFVSVTYGAGGSTRERTHRTVGRIVKETDLAPAAHLTCVAASKAEIDEIVENYWSAGVRHIVALRGDPTEGTGGKYVPHPDGYANASDLVAGISKFSRDGAGFEVSVGCHPETHPESPSMAHDLNVLKAKVDAGATRAISQFFFEPETFFRFRDAVADAGIDVPIIPGIMLQPNFRGLMRMSDLCKTKMPGRIVDLYDGLEDDKETRDALTAQLAAELCFALAEGGVEHFHFYTLNRAGLALATTRLLHLTPRPQHSPQDAHAARNAA